MSGGRQWLNTPGGWRCSECGYLHDGPISISDDRAHECGKRLNGFPDQIWPKDDPGCVQWQYGACTCEHECPDDRPAAPSETREQE